MEWFVFDPFRSLVFYMLDCQTTECIQILHIFQFLQYSYIDSHITTDAMYQHRICHHCKGYWYYQTDRLVSNLNWFEDRVLIDIIYIYG